MKVSNYIFFILFYSSVSIAAPLELEEIRIKFAELNYVDLFNTAKPIQPKKILKSINLIEAKIPNAGGGLYVLPESDEGMDKNASVEFLAEDKKIYLLPIRIETARSSIGLDEASHECEDEADCTPPIFTKITGLLPLNLVTPEATQIEIKIDGIPKKTDLDLSESRLTFESMKNEKVGKGYNFTELSWNKESSILTIEKEKMKTFYDKLPDGPVNLHINLLDKNRTFSASQFFTIHKAPIHLKVQITKVPKEGWKTLMGKYISIIGDDGFRKLVKIQNQETIDVGYIPRDSSFSYWITLEDANFPSFFKRSIPVNKKTANKLKFDYNLDDYCLHAKCLLKEEQR